MEKMYDAIEQSRGEVKDVVYKELIESFAQIKKIKERGLYKVHFIETIVQEHFDNYDERHHVIVRQVQTYKTVVQNADQDQASWESGLDTWIGYSCDISDIGEIDGGGSIEKRSKFQLKQGRKKIDFHSVIHHNFPILYKWEKIN